MDNCKGNNTLESETIFDIPPMKTGRRYLNSLVIKSVISLTLAWMNLSSTDLEIQGLINETGRIPVFLILFIAYLVMVSITESLALLVADILKGFVKMLRTSKQ